MRPTLVHHLLIDAAERCPERRAVIQGDRSITWADLAGEACRLSRWLRQQELRRSDRVAVLLDRSIEQVSALFGVAMSGAAFVLINAGLRAHQVAHIVRDSGAKVLITSSDFAGKLEELEPAPRVLFMDEAPQDPDHSWPLIRGACPATAGEAPGLIGEDLADIIYTSGSTGLPKGVVLTHRNIVEGARIVSGYLGVTGEDRLISLLPFNFDYGLNQLTSAALHACTLVIHEYFLPRDLISVLQRERITGFAGLRPIWLSMFSSRARLPEGQAFPHLRYLTNTGGKVPREVVQKIRGYFPDARLFLMYGLTEAFRSTYLPPEELDRRPTSIGRAIPEVEILVLKKDGQEAAPGEEGELVHRGALVSRGYWNQPEKTARVFRKDPVIGGRTLYNETVVYSGDMVTRDEEGFLYFVSRRDQLIKAGGHRVSPDEIEEVLLRLSGATAAVVFAREVDDSRDTIIVAVLELEALDDKALMRQCRKELPRHMIPGVIQARPRLPRSANGKIDRAGVRAECPEIPAPGRRR